MTVKDVHPPSVDHRITSEGPSQEDSPHIPVTLEYAASAAKIEVTVSCPSVEIDYQSSRLEILPPVTMDLMDDFCPWSLESTTSAHDCWLSQLAFSPDSRTLVSASGDFTFALWDVPHEHGGALTLLHRHSVSQIPNAVAWHPNGVELAVGFCDGTVELYQWASAASSGGRGGSASSSSRTLKHLRTISQHQEHVFGLDYSPQGLLVSGSADGSVCVYGPGPSRPLRYKLADDNHHAVGVFRVRFSPSGDCIAIASNDHCAYIVDAESGAYLTTLTGHTGCVYGVAWSNSGERVATSSNDGTVRVYSTGGEVLHVLRGHGTWVKDIAWQANDATVLSGGFDERIRVWSARSGQELVCIEETAVALPWQAAVMALAVSPDGKRFASGSCDRTVKLYSFSSNF